MIIEDLLEKHERQQLALLQELLQHNGIVSRSELREGLHLSKVALDNQLEALANTLQLLDSHTALTLTEDSVSLKLSGDFDIKLVYARFIQEALKFQLLDYAFMHPGFSITKMSAFLAISEATLFRKIKEVNALISEFQVKIKNGYLHGEELQIRYFYFQLYSQAKTYQELNEIDSHNSYLKMIAALEKTFACQVSTFNHFRLSLWLHISKIRQKSRDTQHSQLLTLMVPFTNDPLYLKTRQLTLLLTSRFAFEVKEEESMLHFAFLMSMSVLPESFFTGYDLIRNRRSPISQADTWVRETILLFYQPRKPSIPLEIQVNYFLAHFHSRLYFLTGALLSPFGYRHKEVSSSPSNSSSLEDLPAELISQVLAIFKRDDQELGALTDVSLSAYANLLALIDMKISHPIQVGLNLWVPQLERELILHDVAKTLTQIAGVSVSLFQKEQTYDIILTTSEPQSHYLGQPIVFSAADWTLSYHLEQVIQTIQQLQYV